MRAQHSARASGRTPPRALGDEGTRRWDAMRPHTSIALPLRLTHVRRQLDEAFLHAAFFDADFSTYIEGNTSKVRGTRTSRIKTLPCSFSVPAPETWPQSGGAYGRVVRLAPRLHAGAHDDTGRPGTPRRLFVIPSPYDDQSGARPKLARSIRRFTALIAHSLRTISGGSPWLAALIPL